MIEIASIGKPRLSTKVSFYSMLLMLITIGPFSNYWGVNGLMLSLIISSSYNLVHGWIIVCEKINLNKFLFLKPSIISVISALIVSVPLLLVKNYYFDTIFFGELIKLLFIGFCNFAFVVFLLNKTTKWNFYKMLKFQYLSTGDL